ncbi:MAG: IPExxxVDY family protein [Bacteroidetes bacterium]|nr:IPExxxVDY family protein [Bacteroidota bacterium]
MATLNKSKKLVLDNSMLEHDYFENSALIGIVCPYDSHRFIWHLNKAFNFDFQRDHTCEINTEKRSFEVYTFIEDEKLISHTIYTNRKKTDFMLEEAKNIDFIWMIKAGYLQKTYIELLTEVLKKMNVVVYSFPIHYENLKSKQLLIL